MLHCAVTSSAVCTVTGDALGAAPGPPFSATAYTATEAATNVAHAWQCCRLAVDVDTGAVLLLLLVLLRN